MTSIFPYSYLEPCIVSLVALFPPISVHYYHTIECDTSGPSLVSKSPQAQRPNSDPLRQALVGFT